MSRSRVSYVGAIPGLSGNAHRPVSEPISLAASNPFFAVPVPTEIRSVGALYAIDSRSTRGFELLVPRLVTLRVSPFTTGGVLKRYLYECDLLGFIPGI